MENMAEQLQQSEQQIKLEPVGSPAGSHHQAVSSVAGPIVTHTHSHSHNNTPVSGELAMSPHELATSIARTDAAMLDNNEFRTQLSEPTYQTLNGRMSPPGYNTNNSYATLTPLQPLPPISTVSDKFSHGSTPAVSGSFALMQNNGIGVGVDMNSYRYDKLSGMGVNMNMNPSIGANPLGTMAGNGYAQQSLSPYAGYAQNGGHSPKPEVCHKQMMTPNTPYESYSRGLMAQTSSRLHSPNPMMASTLNGLSAHSPNTSSLRDHQRGTAPQDSPGSKHDLEEINTKELAQKISSELKRYSIPQAVFAQRVLCRSQGTLSDLLRNPKPWSKLKSGRETFRRMWKWLQEPEFQRMSALRLAGMLSSIQLHFISYSEIKLTVKIPIVTCLLVLFSIHLTQNFVVHLIFAY